MRLALPFALALAGCDSGPVPAATALSSPSVPAAPDSAPARSAAPAAPSSSASAPALPSEICERADRHHGAWQPTVEEVVAAAVVLPSQCLGPRDRPAAIRACAARLGTTTVKVGLGSLDEGLICEESFLPATWKGRRWIVLDVTSFSVAAAASTGSAFAAELRGAKAVLYLDHTGMVDDCKSAAGMPSGAPAELAKLPADLARFLCGYDR